MSDRLKRFERAALLIQCAGKLDGKAPVRPIAVEAMEIVGAMMMHDGVALPPHYEGPSPDEPPMTEQDVRDMLARLWLSIANVAESYATMEEPYGREYQKVALSSQALMRRLEAVLWWEANEAPKSMREAPTP